MSLVDDILNGLGLGSDPVDVQGLIPGIGQGYDEASESFEQGYQDAINYLEMGNAESADQILEGLGMSIAEREKWFDVATKALEPVIEYGEEYKADAREFMDYAKELVFNPDAIYGTEMWDALKGQMVEAVTNSASAKSGLLSGNYLDELGKRVMTLGADFRNSEIGNALGGFNAAMIPVGAGLNAYGQIANNAMNVGSGNAADYMRAYGQIGGNEFTTGTNMAQLAGNYGNQMGQMAIDRASEIANLELTQQLANQNASAQNTSSLLGLAGNLLPSFLENEQRSDILKFLTGNAGVTSSGGGGSYLPSFSVGPNSNQSRISSFNPLEYLP